MNYKIQRLLVDDRTYLKYWPFKLNAQLKQESPLMRPRHIVFNAMNEIQRLINKEAL